MIDGRKNGEIFPVVLLKLGDDEKRGVIF